MPPEIFGHKNPLDTWEIEGRAFAAEMLPPGQSASGFFYFQTGYRKGWSLQLSGLKEADTGRESTVLRNSDESEQASRPVPRLFILPAVVGQAPCLRGPPGRPFAEQRAPLAGNASLGEQHSP